MKQTNHLKIVLGPNGTSFNNSIELNGQPLKYVKSINLQADVREFTQVTITLSNVNVDLEGDVNELIELTNVIKGEKSNEPN